MFVNTYNKKGEKIGQTELPSEIFDVKISPDLIHQVVVSQLANRRQGTAHAKDRGEVRGGGRKPWRQKGTGRARHGSIRSPLWRHGGVTFGPLKEKNFKKKIPQKMRKLALFMVLSAKVKENLLVLLDELKIEKPQKEGPQFPAGQVKTKWMVEILKKLPCWKKSCLIALPEMDKDIILSTRNIPKIATIQSKDLNCLDALSFKYLIMPQKSIETIKETFKI